MMKVLSESPQCLVASPGLLAQAGRPAVPADLTGLPSLAWGPANRGYAWRLQGAGGATVNIPHTPRLVTEDMLTLKLAALAGVGIVQLPRMMVASDLADGALVDLLPEWSPPSGIIHAVFPSRRGLLPSVRALLDFLAKEYQYGESPALAGVAP